MALISEDKALTDLLHGCSCPVGYNCQAPDCVECLEIHMEIEREKMDAAEERLRRAMYGQPQEVVDAFCEWYFGHNGFSWALDQIASVFEAFKALLSPFVASMAEFLSSLNDPALFDQPRKERRRPPRYAGPQNKGRSWTRQPPRVARSNCRRTRR